MPSRTTRLNQLGPRSASALPSPSTELQLHRDRRPSASRRLRAENSTSADDHGGRHSCGRSAQGNTASPTAMAQTSSLSGIARDHQHNAAYGSFDHPSTNTPINPVGNTARRAKAQQNVDYLGGSNQMNGSRR